jgi:hypothetical protein
VLGIDVAKQDVRDLVQQCEQDFVEPLAASGQADDRGVQGSPGRVERVALTAAAAGRGGSSPLAVAEKKGTIIMLAPGRARWPSEIWGVIRFHPLWLTWDLAGRAHWLSLIRRLLGNSGRQGRALG